MKMLSLALLFLLGACASARSTWRPPAALIKVIQTTVQQDAGDHCSKWGAHGGPPLAVSRVAELPAGGVLLLVNVPDYFCETVNGVLPVVVDRSGNWHWDTVLTGEPVSLGRSADGALWLHTRWVIEGAYPLLYRSGDGANWTPIELPERAGRHGPFESIGELCAEGGRLYVSLAAAGDGDEKASPKQRWAPPLDAVDGKHLWRHAAREAHCTPLAEPGAGSWTRREGEPASETLLGNGAATIALPSMLPAAGHQ